MLWKPWFTTLSLRRLTALNLPGLRSCVAHASPMCAFHCVSSADVVSHSGKGEAHAMCLHHRRGRRQVCPLDSSQPTGTQLLVRATCSQMIQHETNSPDMWDPSAMASNQMFDTQGPEGCYSYQKRHLHHRDRC